MTFFDTAEVYGPFVSEEIVGEALAPLKGKVQIASKSGSPCRKPGRRQDGPWRPAWRDSRPENIRRAVEGPLKRLRVETTDIYHQGLCVVPWRLPVLHRQSR